MRSESTSALGQPKLTKPTFGLLRLTIFKMARNGGGLSRLFYSKTTLFGRSGRTRPLAGHPPGELSQLSNSSKGFCDMAQKNLSGKHHDPLKNGGNGPIKTLDVVTGPPEGGEVNTNGRA